MKTLLLGEMITNSDNPNAVLVQHLEAVLHFKNTDAAMTAGEAYLMDGGDGWCIIENCAEVNFLIEKKSR